MLGESLVDLRRKDPRKDAVRSWISFCAVQLLRKPQISTDRPQLAIVVRITAGRVVTATVLPRR
jgi:hypothetical protein